MPPRLLALAIGTMVLASAGGVALIGHLRTLKDEEERADKRRMVEEQQERARQAQLDAATAGGQGPGAATGATAAAGRSAPSARAAAGAAAGDPAGSGAAKAAGAAEATGAATATRAGTAGGAATATATGAAAGSGAAAVTSPRAGSGTGARGGAGTPSKACPLGMALVKLSSPFCIDLYEYPGGRTIPRTGVSFAEAGRLCGLRGARLCADGEWERACRGAGGASYPYGQVYDDERCNANHAGEPVAEAGSFPRCRSLSGAYDMSGNVAEWVASGAVRGGSVGGGAALTRCSHAVRGVPLAGAPEVGFRCCQPPAAP
jgi:hypothetical protein